MLLIPMLLCTCLLLYLHWHDMSIWLLLPLAMVPLALGLFLGPFGTIGGAIYTAALAKLDTRIFGDNNRQQGLVQG